MRLLKYMLLATALPLILSGCFILDDLVTYDLEVVNRCSGGNYTVAFYFDGVFQDNITTRRLYTGITHGTHVLEALGTGSGGTYFRREWFFEADTRWTLCPYATLRTTDDVDTSGDDAEIERKAP